MAETVVEALLGNEDVRERLVALYRAQRLHHCLLFEGPSGLGKAASAVWLAQALNCMDADESERPCGVCWSCRSIRSGEHPDVIRVGLDPERTAPIISVRQAREIISGLALRPYHARQRLIILDPAEAMKSEAANALLKTFEEPPQDTGFVLVCESAGRLLPTVRSRSQRIRFRPVETPRLAAWLRAQGVGDPAEADWIARLADGCPGRALALREGEAQSWRDHREALLRVLEGGSVEARFAYAQDLTTAKKGGRSSWTAEVEVVLDTLERLVRDALARASGAPLETLYNRDQLPLVEDWAVRLGLAGCERVGRAIARAREELEAYVSGRLVLDALLATVAAELGRL